MSDNRMSLEEFHKGFWMCKYCHKLSFMDQRACIHEGIEDNYLLSTKKEVIDFIEKGGILLRPEDT